MFMIVNAYQSSPIGRGAPLKTEMFGVRISTVVPCSYSPIGSRHGFQTSDSLGSSPSRSTMEYITWVSPRTDGKCACGSYSVGAGAFHDDYESRHAPDKCFNAFGESYRIKEVEQ